MTTAVASQLVGLLNSRIGLIILFGVGGGALSVWLMKNFMDSIPVELDQAAYIDGATHWQTQLTVAKLHNVWHPEVVYDVHQMGANAARLFVPPFLDPVDPNVDPILVQETSQSRNGDGALAPLVCAEHRSLELHA